MYKHPIHLIGNEWRYNICNMYENKCTSAAFSCKCNFRRNTCRGTTGYGNV